MTLVVGELLEIRREASKTSKEKRPFNSSADRPAVATSFATSDGFELGKHRLKPNSKLFSTRRRPFVIGALSGTLFEFSPDRPVTVVRVLLDDLMGPTRDVPAQL